MKIHLVYNRIQHHASHSGYDQIHRYLRDLVQVESHHFESEAPQMFGMVWDPLIEHSGMDWYDKCSLAMEVATARRLLKGSHEIYHNLYGEDNYRYLGSLREIAHFKKSKIICSYHQPPSIFEKVMRSKAALRQLDAVIAVSSGQAAYLASLVTDSSRVFFVPHGVDTSFYHPVPHQTGDRVRCLCVGQWLRDYDMLKSVAKQLSTRDPRLSFTVITSAQGASLLGGIENLVAITGVSEQELLATYQQADIFVLPLTDCTASNALMEALACGLPLVTTDVGGIKDYVDSSCAITVPPGDVDGMCDAIAGLAGDEELRKRMGAHSRARALEFDWKVIASRFMEIYSG